MEARSKNLCLRLINLSLMNLQMSRNGKLIGNSISQQQNMNQHSTYLNEQQNILPTALTPSGTANGLPSKHFANRINYPKGPQVIPHTGNCTQQQQTQSNSKSKNI